MYTRIHYKIFTRYTAYLNKLRVGFNLQKNIVVIIIITNVIIVIRNIYFLLNHKSVNLILSSLKQS